jgi:hypothetical protein
MILSFGLLRPSIGLAQARPVTDSIRAELAALKVQVSAIAKKQAETEILLKEVSALLQKVESTGNPAGAPNCKAVQATQNQWLKFDVGGCASLARNGRSLSFTLNIKNTTSADTLFIGVPCCYDSWLKIVDDQGRAWAGNQNTVTRLPTYMQKDYVQLAPGGEFSVTAVVTPSSGSIADEAPRFISISGELLRRTPPEQRLIDRGQDSFNNQGHPLPFGIARITVEGR